MTQRTGLRSALAARAHVCARLATGVGLAALMAACSTTPPAPGPGPVVDRRPVEDPVIVQPSDVPGNRDPGDVDVVDTPDDDTPDADADRPDAPREVRSGITPAHLAGQDLNRLGLLLPLSSSNGRLREEAQSMLRAAELALFERDEADTVLIVVDTRGTADGAREAARSAMSGGADVLLGPVLAGSVEAASREARRADVPMIAFSTDTRVAGRGTYLLSFPPEAEVERIVDYASGTGVTNFAILGPSNAYGQRVARAYERAVAMEGGQVTASESYDGDTIEVMQEPAQRLARFHAQGERVGGKQAFEAVLLPEGGTALRSLAPLLPYYDSSMNRVQFLGTALWMREDTAREPALRGGLFAGPDRDARAGFEREFERAFGTAPTRLASLAHDAVDIGASVADGDPDGRTRRVEDFRGFYGADGFVSFGADGQPRRGLAVYEVVGGTFRVVDPAPTGPVGTN